MGTKITNLQEAHIYVLKKMCEMVGATYEDIDFKEDGWWNKYEWSQEQELEFKKWLVEKLKANTPLRRHLTGLSYNSKKLRESVAVEYASFYGWKYIKDLPVGKV